MSEKDNQQLVQQKSAKLIKVKQKKKRACNWVILANWILEKRRQCCYYYNGTLYPDGSW